MEWCKWGGLALICITAFLYSLFYVETAGKYSTSYSPDEGNYINMAKRLLSEGVYSFWGTGRMPTFLRVSHSFWPYS